MQGILRFFKRIEAAMASIATVCLFLMTAVVAADVFMRYVFSAPLAWTHDLVGLYLVSTSFAFVLSSTFSSHGHMGIDILTRRLPRIGRRYAELLVNALAIIMFALIAWVMFERAWESYAAREVLAGLYAWPTWPPAFVLASGSTLLVLRLMIRILELIFLDDAVPEVIEHEMEAF